MKEFWNERNNLKEYIYGKEPNVFFKEQLDQDQPGKLLLPADGEGRNGVYAAEQGWEVNAVDSSQSGQKKALQLAGEKNVQINYKVQDLRDFDSSSITYDVIGLIYVHLPTDFRSIFHQRCVAWLKPGGKIILEGFHKAQLPLRSGGPKNIDMLFSEKDLQNDFWDLKELNIERKIVNLQEGNYHRGKAEVVRLVGIK